MANPKHIEKLREIVKKSRSKGKSIMEVRAAMEHVGFSDEEIEAALSEDVHFFDNVVPPKSGIKPELAPPELMEVFPSRSPLAPKRPSFIPLALTITLFFIVATFLVLFLKGELILGGVPEIDSLNIVPRDAPLTIKGNMNSLVKTLPSLKDINIFYPSTQFFSTPLGKLIETLYGDLGFKPESIYSITLVVDSPSEFAFIFIGDFGYPEKQGVLDKISGLPRLFRIGEQEGGMYRIDMSEGTYYLSFPSDDILIMGTNSTVRRITDQREENPEGLLVNDTIRRLLNLVNDSAVVAVSQGYSYPISSITVYSAMLEDNDLLVSSLNASVYQIVGSWRDEDSAIEAENRMRSFIESEKMLKSRKLDSIEDAPSGGPFTSYYQNYLRLYSEFLDESYVERDGNYVRFISKSELGDVIWILMWESTFLDEHKGISSGAQGFSGLIPKVIGCDLGDIGLVMENEADSKLEDMTITNGKCSTNNLLPGERTRCVITTLDCSYGSEFFEEEIKVQYTIRGETQESSGWVWGSASHPL